MGSTESPAAAPYRMQRGDGADRGRRSDEEGGESGEPTAGGGDSGDVPVERSEASPRQSHRGAESLAGWTQRLRILCS